MAWVRYDDNFHDHDKVALLRAECPDALALHLLANTWTSRTSRPGFVPTPIPTVLVGRAKARKWTPLLVEAELWQEVEGGWEFVNHARYRNSEKRQTPGTPDDLSAKRAAAGSRGGAATAAKKAANSAANPASSPASVQQPASKPCSPVVASNEATPEPVPTTSALAVPAVPDAGIVVAAYVEGATASGKPRPSERLRGKIGRDAKRLLGEGVPLDEVVRAARSCGERGWDDLDRERQQPQRNVRPMTGPRQAPPGTHPHMAHLYEQA